MAAIIPLGHGSHRDSSSLPEGFHSPQLSLPRTELKRSASRAGSPLLFGLAPRGVFRASGVTTGAVGSYPTFSPLPNVACISSASRRFTCAMPPRSLRRRSILCGTFRDAIVAPGFSPAPRPRPLTLSGALPMLRLPSAIPRSPFGARKCPTCVSTVSGLSSRFGFVAAALRRRSSASASDHPAHPPTLL